MRALVFHFSSLVGILVLVNQLWDAAEIERTVFMAFGSGLAMYTVLMVGFAVSRRFLAHVEPPTVEKAVPPVPDPVALAEESVKDEQAQASLT